MQPKFLLTLLSLIIATEATLFGCGICDTDEVCVSLTQDGRQMICIKTSMIREMNSQCRECTQSERCVVTFQETRCLPRSGSFNSDPCGGCPSGQVCSRISFPLNTAGVSSDNGERNETKSTLSEKRVQYAPRNRRFECTPIV